MPKTIEVQVGVGKTVNLGNYESLRIDVWERVTLEEGDEVPRVCEDARIRLNARCDSMVKREINDRNVF